MRDERRRRLVRRRPAAPRCRPRRRRRHDEALGWRQRHRVLLGVRRRRRSPRCTAAGDRPPRVQLRRRLRRTRRRAVCRGARQRRHAEPVHRVQPVGEVRPPRRAGRAARIRRGRHRAPCQHRSRPTDGRYTLRRGADPAKDQSYVVHMLDQAQLARTMFPVGGMHKSRVRELAASIDLRTADKPDSQDVCFITSTGGRVVVPRRPDPVPREAPSSTPPARDSARSSRSSWSPSVSAKGSACRAAGRSGTSSTSTPTAASSPSAPTPICSGRNSSSAMRLGRCASGRRRRSSRAAHTAERGPRRSPPRDGGGVVVTVDRTAAPDRSRSERRVLRPGRHDGCFGGGIAADRTGRRGASGDAQSAGGGGAQRLARPARD